MVFSDDYMLKTLVMVKKHNDACSQVFPMTAILPAPAIVSQAKWNLNNQRFLCA